MSPTKRELIPWVSQMTVLMVNRSSDAIDADMRHSSSRETTLRQYCYSPQSIPTADQAMLRSSASYRLDAAHSARVSIPKDSFVLLTDVPE